VYNVVCRCTVFPRSSQIMHVDRYKKATDLDAAVGPSDGHCRMKSNKKTQERVCFHTLLLKTHNSIGQRDSIQLLCSYTSRDKSLRPVHRQVASQR